MKITEVSDYIIFRLRSEDDSDLNVLKHQKLLYYIQSWHLAFYGKKMFEGDFQAWIHGPVNREIYNVYKDSKYLYSELTLEDIQEKSNIEKLSIEEKLHIDNILDYYAPLSPTQLESMTHNEDPWILARRGYDQFQRCEVVIDEDIIRKYYSARLVES